MGNKAGGKGKKDPTILTDEDIKTLKLNTQYTEDEIQAWHLGFLKDCPSGKLDKKQFLNVYKVCILLQIKSFICSFFFLLEILSGG
jgi:Ca2+-binding EF-hand superfamily protein